jgi:hypothetical protein
LEEDMANLNGEYTVNIKPVKQGDAHELVVSFDLRVGKKLLLENTRLSLQKGRIYGIVGNNGK